MTAISRSSRMLKLKRIPGADTECRSGSRLVCVLFLCGLLCIALQCRADVMSVTTNLEISKDTVASQLIVQTLNAGDSPLMDLRLRTEGFAEPQQTLIRPCLNPGEANRVVFDLEPLGPGQGSAALVVWTEFRGRDRTLATLCDAVLYASECAVKPDLMLDADDLALDGLGSLSCVIRNTSNEQRSVTVRALAPGSLSILEGEKRLAVAPNGSRRVVFKILNRFASPRDDHTLCVIAEYTGHGKTWATVHKAQVRIESRTERRRVRMWVLGGMVACFGLAGLIALGVERGRKGRRQT
jgi:hypothetical protein